MLRVKAVFLVILVLAGIVCYFRRDLIVKLWNDSWDSFMEKGMEEAQRTETETDTGTAQTNVPTAVDKTEIERAVYTEEQIYTFLQGPQSWKDKKPWSGEWSNKELAGSTFGVFGCGLCDLAGIYSTMTPYECSPLDMYEYAQEVSEYSPEAGWGGAIDWPYLKATLNAVGIGCEIYDKDETYEKFVENVADSVGGIMLVAAENDDTYWETTGGHYVNIWSYDKATDTVFLGDSGDPDHNRQRIPLKYVYSALKTAGQHQYLLVYAYDESENTWKYSGISDKWNKPDYYRPKQ